jgi:hypothetical protein
VDKRQHLRVATRLRASCEAPGVAPFDAVVIDISLGGARFESSQTPAFGLQLEIVAVLPGAAAASRLPATVRWVGPGSFGVQFGLLGARDTYRIADLMGKSLREAKAG